MELRQISYGEFSSTFHRKALAARAALNGTLELTHRCNLTCAHCYNNLPISDPARRRELTLAEIHSLLDEMKAEGCLWLLLTGGEILARADFFDIYAYAKRKGFLITLFTNATLVTPAVADKLAASPPFSIEVTLYGRTQATYEGLTGIPGSHAKCLRGIELLRSRGLPLKLKTVAVRHNIHEVLSMKAFAEDELGVEFKFDAMINPRIDCSSSPLATRLSPAEIVSLDVADPQRLGEWQAFAQKFQGPVHAPENSELYHCGGGISSFAIDPYGKMSICVLSHCETFDVREGRFREGWRNFLFRARQKKTTRPTKCRQCHLQAMCGMCPANGELENRDPEEPVDFLCHVAHLRARAIGAEIPAHGDCEYCTAEGKRLLDEESKTLTLPLQSAAAAPLNVLSAKSGCGTGACGSCAAH
ncbi:MAG: radical SAM protein [Myxococcaceae bacterium]